MMNKDAYKPNILIIDDELEIQKSLQLLLEDDGYSIKGAMSLRDAKKKISNEFFNVAIVDLKLPDGTGLDLVREIRSASKDTRIIIFTGFASVENVIQAMNEGACNYLQKPLNADEFVTVIESAIETQRLQHENERLFKELQKANDKLKVMDERKSSFVAAVSHEFCNPLFVVLEVLEQLYEGIGGQRPTEQQEEILDVSKREVERLLRMVSDLLDISKIEAGKLSLRMEEIDLAAHLQEVLLSFDLLSKKKAVEITFQIPDQSVVAKVDQDKFTQIVRNLLSNALRYTPEGGRVEVALSDLESEIRVEIADEGPGIAEEYREKIFDKFERIQTERQEGTGLGLPIARDLVNLHHGRIWIENKPGNGSRFYFTIPKKN